MAVLTPHSDMAPCTRVDVLFSSTDLVAGTATATVYQISSEGQVPVRNAEKAFASGGLFVTDYEVPPGIPVTYRAQQFDENGNDLGFTESATTQVDIASDVALIQDPLDPASAVQVVAEVTFASALTRTRTMQLQRIGNDTIALMGQMGLLENVPLSVWGDSSEVSAALDRVLARTQLLIRTMPSFPIPRTLHVAIGQPTRIPVTAPYGTVITQQVTLFQLAGSEVTRSSLNIIVPVVTWQTYMDAFPTWADFNAAYSTWLDAEQNPPAQV